jgi:phage/plasmid-associated DNA primase
MLTPTNPSKAAIENEAIRRMEAMGIDTNRELIVTIEMVRDILEKITVPEGDKEKFASAKQFVLDYVTKLSETEGKEIIEIDMKEKFGIKRNGLALLKDTVNEQIKIAKAQKKSQKIIQAEGYVIDPEFAGLYRLDVDENGKMSVRPYSDHIAHKIIDTLHVLSYKDMLYSYDNEVGCFKENSHLVGAEVTRILNGIMHEEKSNSIAGYKKVVMTLIADKNRKNEFPFLNVHKIIPMKNGILTINYETLEATLLDQDPDRKKYPLNYIFPINYDPGAPTEPIIKELRQYVENPAILVQFLAQTVAQTLVDQPYRKAYFLYGQWGYGKSFIGIELFQKRFITKDFCAKIPLSRLANDSENRFTIAGLEGKLANIKDEMSFFNLKDVGTFKEVTGSFEIWSEPKGKMAYAARSSAVHLFIENRLARFDEAIRDDDAFWDRVYPVEFNVTRFKRDTKAADRIFTEEFMSGLFNLVLEMALKMVQTGDLIIDIPWEDAREEWMMSCEPAYQFITANMERAASETQYTAILKKDLLRAVQAWYDDNFADSKHRPSTVNELTNVVKMCGGTLDAQRNFSFRRWDMNGHPIYKMDYGKQVKDENGNLVQEEETKKSGCYLLPWAWKEGSKYENKVRKSVFGNRQGNIEEGS